MDTEQVNFDNYNTEASSSPSQAGFIGIGFLVSAVPVFLFNRLFDMPFTQPEFAIVFAACTVLSVAMLTMSYSNVALMERVRLAYVQRNSPVSFSKGASKADKKKEEKIRQNKTHAEANNWSYFQNNIVFVLFFLFFTFYVFVALPNTYRYGLSVVISSVATWQVSTTFRPN